MSPVYLDHAATTPLDPRVLEKMLPYLKEHFGNASSLHAMGRKARFAIEESRERIAAQLGAEPSEIIFTSGGTEADNAALRGMMTDPAASLITSSVEHEAILQTAEALHSAGQRVTFLAPSATGAVTPRILREALTTDTSLVSLMHANNEIGTLTPLRAITDLCRAQGVALHTDAVQTAGLFNLKVDALGVDLLSMSAHKFYGPKGVGALYVRSGVEYHPQMTGGAQERRRRGGTEHVAGIVGMAEAFTLAVEEAESRTEHVRALQRRMIALLQDAFGTGIVFNTPVEDLEATAPHIVNISFPPYEGVPLDGEMLLLNLDMEQVMASAGSACTSGALEPSHVLLALGRDRPLAAATVRFSFGKDTTTADIDFAVEKLSAIVQRMRR